MKFSENWLRQHVKTSATRDELAATLTAIGLEVEEMTVLGAALDGVVVARIVEGERHLQADKLQVYQVDAGGSQLLQIVCGAPNARPGLVAPLATIGTRVGELTINAATLRGIDSNGIMEMRLLLQRINQQHNCTILLSSHILSEIEKLCTDVAIINSGSLVYQGTMQSLLSAATGKEVIIIHTDNLEKARKIIDGRFAAIEKDNKLLVTVNQKSEAAFVIRTLVENGIDIYSAGLETTGLEASFLHLLNDNHKS